MAQPWWSLTQWYRRGAGALRWHAIAEEGLPPGDTLYWVAGYEPGSQNLGTPSKARVWMTTYADGEWMSLCDSDPWFDSLAIITHWQPLPTPTHPAPDALPPPVREEPDAALQQQVAAELARAHSVLAQYEAQKLEPWAIGSIMRQIKEGEAAQREACPYRMRVFLNGMKDTK